MAFIHKIKKLPIAIMTKYRFTCLPFSKSCLIFPLSKTKVDVELELLKTVIGALLALCVLCQWYLSEGAPVLFRDWLHGWRPLCVRPSALDSLVQSGTRSGADEPPAALCCT